MQDPYTSNVCKHTYDKVIITMVQQAPQQQLDCPVHGCRQKIRISDLAPNKTLARKLTRMKTNQSKNTTEDEEYERVV